MNKEKYLATRKALEDEAQTLIDAGKIDEAEAKMNEIKELDESFEAHAKAAAALKAMSGTPAGMNIQSITDANASLTPTTAAGTLEMNGAKEDEIKYDSEIYKTAWAKTMMKQPLSAEESDAYKMVNAAYTHTTENTPVVIPQSVSAGIWDLVGDLYPYWEDVTKTFVRGKMTVITGDESSESGWYDEGTKTEDGKEIIGELGLDGCELSRSITVSWKLQAMAIEDFIPYIQRKMAEKMGAGLGYGVTHGKGKPGASDTFKPEPLGIVTALEKETGTPQITKYTAGEMKYSDLTTTRAKVKGGYAPELAVYANSNTIWNDLANVKDANGRPIMIADPISGGVLKIFGMVVKEDGSMKDGEVLMSNPKRGYAANVNKEMTVLPEEHVKDRTTDYCGYAIVDGGATTTKAHALLQEGE